MTTLVVGQEFKAQVINSSFTLYSTFLEGKYAWSI